MATSRQTPRVWTDAIRGSEILANCFKLGANAVVLWLSIGMILGGMIGGVWFLEGHHVAGSPTVAAPPPQSHRHRRPDRRGERIHVPKADVQRYTGRSFETVSRRVQESLFLGFLVAVAGTVTAPISHARVAARPPKAGISGALRSPRQMSSQPLPELPTCLTTLRSQAFRSSAMPKRIMSWFVARRKAARARRLRNCSSRSALTETGQFSAIQAQSTQVY